MSSTSDPFPALRQLSMKRKARGGGGLGGVQQRQPPQPPQLSQQQALQFLRLQGRAAAASLSAATQRDRQVNQGDVRNYLNALRGRNQAQQRANMSRTPTQPPPSPDAPDHPSAQGRFGWMNLRPADGGQDGHSAATGNRVWKVANFVPYIMRRDDHGGEGGRFVAVKFLEKFLQNYLTTLPASLHACHRTVGHPATSVESALLDEINLRHCDSYYGKAGIGSDALMVSAEDAVEVLAFCELCHRKVVSKRPKGTDRCGYYRVNGQNLLPFVMIKIDDLIWVKMVPLFFFEDDPIKATLKTREVTGWDLAHLKMALAVQAIRPDLMSAPSLTVVSLEEVKSRLASGTFFEEYWPAEHRLDMLNTNNNEPSRKGSGFWTVKPPPKKKPQTAAPSPAKATPPSSLSPSALEKMVAGLPSITLTKRKAKEAPPPREEEVECMEVDGNGGGRGGQQQQPSMQVVERPSPTPPPPPRRANTNPGVVTIPSLDQLKEFELPAPSNWAEPFSDGQLTYLYRKSYKFQRALLDQKLVACINVKPGEYNDLMLTLPDLLENLGFGSTHEPREYQAAADRLRSKFGIALYKGNKGHQWILQNSKKCAELDPVPLVRLREVLRQQHEVKRELRRAVRK